MDEELKNLIKEYIRENLSIRIEDSYEFTLFANSQRVIRLLVELEGETISSDSFYFKD